ncbi:MAG: hypothetical protein AAF721_14955, partial [Myxococcota bacterium]
MKESKNNKAKLAALTVALAFVGCCDAPEEDPLRFRCAATDVPGIGGLDAVTINGDARLYGRDGEF